MIQTVTIDIINDKAIKLLQDLELLNLIRMRKENTPSITNWSERYKGAMSKQPMVDIERQLKELRNEWE
jgi:hypothetical protein